MIKTVHIIFLILLGLGQVLLAQEGKDSLNDKSIYAPFPYDALTPEESWDIYRTAFVKKLEKKGATQEEIDERLAVYEEVKAEYIARVQEDLRLAEIYRMEADMHREKADMQRAMHELQRQEAAEMRELQELERLKAAELREWAEMQRMEEAELRRFHDIQRKEAEQMRRLAAVEREKANELRRQAEKMWKDFRPLLTKNVQLSKNVKELEPITFEIRSETTLTLGVRSHLSSGSAKLVMYNPEGKVEAELNLEHDEKRSKKDGEMSYTSGSLDKKITGLKAGIYNVLITPKNAEGYIAFSVSEKKN
ncbi:MAG: hypothetical protein AAGC47_08480 [Bacteroidota bacterium]